MNHCWIPTPRTISMILVALGAVASGAAISLSYFHHEPDPGTVLSDTKTDPGASYRIVDFDMGLVAPGQCSGTTGVGNQRLARAPHRQQRFEGLHLCCP